MMMCNVDTFVGCTWEAYATSKAWTLSAGDGTKRVYAKFRDEAGNESLPSSDDIIMDTALPTGTIVINDDETYTATAAVTLTLDAGDTPSGVAAMTICNVNTFVGCDWESYATSKDWTLTTTDGTKTVYAKYRDEAGNESEITSDTIILDTLGPEDSILINSGATYTTSADVELTLHATDETAGVSDMMICNVDTFVGCTWEAYATSKDWTLTTTDGTKTVYAKYRDEAGNESATFSDTIVLDTEAPIGTIVINTGDEYTNTREVSLALDATDATSGVDQMMICNVENFMDCIWEDYATAKTWDLTAGDGDKTVYVKYRDEAGNESETYSDTIVLDTEAPTGGIRINAGALYTTNSDVAVVLTAEDVLSGLDVMQLADDEDFTGASWEAFTTGKEHRLTADDGIKTIYVRFRDRAGNESDAYADSIFLDTIAPVGSLSINEGDSFTNSSSVTLTMSAEDSLAGVSEMMLSEDEDFSSVDWEAFAASKGWTLAATDGGKTVYAKYRDAAGNESVAVSDEIILDTQTEVSLLTLGGEEYDEGGALWRTEERKPLFTGEAEAGSEITITITINSESVIGTALAGADGTWSWRPGVELAYGLHEVTITSVDPAGNTATRTLRLEIINPGTEVNASGMGGFLPLFLLLLVPWGYAQMRLVAARRRTLSSR
jgi:hypothetical protein